MSLKEYGRKRNFKRTPEPSNEKPKRKPKGPLRFIVQKHAATRTHYDFRLELEGVLKSWAIPKGPTLMAHDPRLAVHVEDHPLDYGKFEGVIPKGNYGAGTVMIWDSGTYRERNASRRTESEKRLKEGLAKGHLTFILAGKKLNGEFSLVRMKSKRTKDNPNAWLLIKKLDSEASRDDVTKQDRSCVTGRTMQEIGIQSEAKGDIWLPKKGRQKSMRKPSAQKTVPRGHEIHAERPLLTHLQKIFWPNEGITKGDLIRYYDEMSRVILPYLIDRPQSLHRQPNGIRDAGFFHKDMTSFLPRRIQTERVYSASSGRTINYVLCQDRWSLLYLINLGCIELNPWISRRQKLDRPDFVVIDLDPDGNDFRQVVKVAQEVHRLLKKIGARSYCKTSGASGLHICIPTGARTDYETARRFAEAVCRTIHHILPDITSVERNPNRRRGRIYLDFLQNRRGQTLAAPYCVRPRPKATVSTPLKWSEVTSKLNPEVFTITTMAKRIQKVGDLWSPLLKDSVNIEACMKKLLR